MRYCRHMDYTVMCHEKGQTWRYETKRRVLFSGLRRILRIFLRNTVTSLMHFSCSSICPLQSTPLQCTRKPTPEVHLHRHKMSVTGCRWYSLLGCQCGTPLHETKNGCLMVTQCLSCLSICLPPLSPLPLHSFCCIWYGIPCHIFMSFLQKVKTSWGHKRIYLWILIFIS